MTAHKVAAKLYRYLPETLNYKSLTKEIVTLSLSLSDDDGGASALLGTVSDEVFFERRLSGAAYSESSGFHCFEWADGSQESIAFVLGRESWSSSQDVQSQFLDQVRTAIGEVPLEEAKGASFLASLLEEDDIEYDGDDETTTRDCEEDKEELISVGTYAEAYDPNGEEAPQRKQRQPPPKRPVLPKSKAKKKAPPTPARQSRVSAVGESFLNKVGGLLGSSNSNKKGPPPKRPTKKKINRGPPPKLSSALPSGKPAPPKNAPRPTAAPQPDNTVNVPVIEAESTAPVVDDVKLQPGLDDDDDDDDDENAEQSVPVIPSRKSKSPPSPSPIREVSLTGGRRFFGRVENKLAQGKGVMTLRNGTQTYCETWVDGFATGLIFETRPNGNRYYGEYPMGAGCLHRSDGSTLSGQFYNGAPVASQQQVILNDPHRGVMYLGGWAANGRQGAGTEWTFGNGIYRGYWCDGKRQGVGRFFWPSGDQIEEREYDAGVLISKHALPVELNDSLRPEKCETLELSYEADPSQRVIAIVGGIQVPLIPQSLGPQQAVIRTLTAPEKVDYKLLV